MGIGMRRRRDCVAAFPCRRRRRLSHNRHMASVSEPLAAVAPPVPRARRVLATCLGAHILHDGFSDLLYVLLPIWQTEFGLALAQIGFLKTTYSGAMALLQVPA